MIQFKWSMHILLFLVVLRVQSNDLEHKKTVSYLPVNTVIAWDFHDVIAHKNISVITSHAVSLFKNANNRLQLIKLFFCPSFWSIVLNFDQSLNSGDELIEKLVQKYPDQLQRHREQMYAIANLHNLHGIDSSVVDIIKELHTDGYKQVLASNIGEKSLNLMLNKHPDVFNFFDALYFNGTVDIKNQRYANAMKPSPEYFIGLKKFLIDQGFGQSVIVFIDDKQKNLEGAGKANVGIEGIHFLNPAQLNELLIKKEILLKRSVLDNSKK